MTYVNKKGGIIMPRGDGSGPLGLGAMTGRKMGSCAGNILDSTNSKVGKSIGMCLGIGLGGLGLGLGCTRRFRGNRNTKNNNFGG